jgi:hypothetical protein
MLSFAYPKPKPRKKFAFHYTLLSTSTKWITVPETYQSGAGAEFSFFEICQLTVSPGLVVSWRLFHFKQHPLPLSLLPIQEKQNFYPVSMLPKDSNGNSSPVSIFAIRSKENYIPISSSSTVELM